MAEDSDETIHIKCGTTKGDFVMKFVRAWSPNGYDRAVHLFKAGFYDGSHFFRVVPNFLVQFGLSYTEDHELKEFAHKRIEDDPRRPDLPFEKGMMSFAGSGPNSRTSQLFIAYGHNPNLGTQLWESPIGHVVEGMDVIESLHSYGDMPPWGKGPVQGRIASEGPSYIQNEFPLLDSFTHCTVVAWPVQEELEKQEAHEEVHADTATVKERLGASLSIDQQQTKVVYVAALAAILVIIFVILRPKRNKDDKTQ